MTFIEAIIEISKKPEFELCSDNHELNGLYPYLCVYKNGNFVGKLRWARRVIGKNTIPATVDENLITELEK